MKPISYIIFSAFVFLSVNFFFAQESKVYSVRTVSFYNVENLFDTINNPDTYDDERTPKGKYKWNSKTYQSKIKSITSVISNIGKSITKSSPDVIGICEIENSSVLDDLINHPNIKSEGYQYIHFDSPDERGIDVAFLYKNSVFIPENFEKHPLFLYNEEGYRNFTRDQLVVSGYLDDEPFTFIVCHWPSRSGGEAKSKPYRKSAAVLTKRIIDSVRRVNPVSKIIIMGDFNDNPKDDSFKKILRASGKLEPNDTVLLHNPMESLYKKGVGSLAHGDQWHLFDQILISKNLLEKQGYYYWKTSICSPDHLITRKGKYKGYPFRSFSNGNYTKGYSDHFPVYMLLVREVNSE